MVSVSHPTAPTTDEYGKRLLSSLTPEELFTACLEFNNVPADNFGDIHWSLYPFAANNVEASDHKYILSVLPLLRKIADSEQHMKTVVNMVRELAVNPRAHGSVLLIEVFARYVPRCVLSVRNNNLMTRMMNPLANPPACPLKSLAAQMLRHSELVSAVRDVMLSRVTNIRQVDLAMMTLYNMIEIASPTDKPVLARKIAGPGKEPSKAFFEIMDGLITREIESRRNYDIGIPFDFYVSVSDGLGESLAWLKRHPRWPAFKEMAMTVDGGDKYIDDIMDMM